MIRGELLLEQAWENPQLWQPGNPHLYAMRVTITDAASGQVLDVRRDRFGFRESWIDGPNIMFNGYPIKPVGHGPIMRFRPQGNFLFVRGGGRDWLDEVGILGYKCISGLRNTPSQHNIESDTFWKAAEQNNIAALRIQQNSPHILAWDISNEWLCFFWGDALQGARRFKALSDAVRASDPTRWTLANAEGASSVLPFEACRGACKRSWARTAFVVDVAKCSSATLISSTCHIRPTSC